jgi:hypothetical protein
MATTPPTMMTTPAASATSHQGKGFFTGTGAAATVKATEGPRS